MELLGAVNESGNVLPFDPNQANEPTSINTRPIISEQVVYIDLRDERVQEAIGRITRAVREVYDDAEFVSYIGTNPLGVYTEVYTSANDFKDILDIIDTKLSDLNVAAGGVSLIIAPKRKAQAKAA
ncbi:MAG: hypothetical protein ABIQ44_01960 [Chloroflexia bacterium]